MCAIIEIHADVAELADALDLGSSTARCEGSSPFIRIARQDKSFSFLTAGTACPPVPPDFDYEMTRKSGDYELVLF